MLSQAVRAILESSGWSEDRKVPAKSWVDELVAEGFFVGQKAIKVLESFGGLTISPSHAPENVFPPVDIIFDPAHAHGELDRVQYWESRLGVRLSPIGGLATAEVLLLAEDGRVFSCIDQVLWLYGNSLEDAFETSLIFVRRRPPEMTME